MKAEMDAHGVITISPETPVEAFALMHWSKSAALTRETALGPIPVFVGFSTDNLVVNTFVDEGP